MCWSEQARHNRWANSHRHKLPHFVFRLPQAALKAASPIKF